MECTPIDRPSLSIVVIVPTLNEAASIGGCLHSLNELRPPPDRIVVADGGSTDATIEIVRRGGAEILVVPRAGRGGQVVAAVQQATEDIVVIVHADMRFPPDAFSSLREQLTKDAKCPGGCFGHRFDRPGLSLRLVEGWDYFRARYQGISYGDQAQFFRRERLEAVGGFPAQPIMEDVELSWRLLRLGKPCYLGRPVIVSARRFERLGYWRTVTTNLQIRWMYRRAGLAGIQKLYERYYSR